MHHLIDQSHDAIFVIDPETSQFIEVNQRACESLRYTHDELVTLGVIDIEAVLPDDYSWQDVVQKMKLQNGFILMEGMHLRKDKTTYPVEASVKIINLEDQEYIVDLVRDISARKAVETLKDEIMTNVSHELKTPLAIIKTAIYNVDQGYVGEINEKQKNFLDKAYESVWRLELLLSNLIDFSRIKSGSLNMNMDLVDINKVIEGVVKTLKQQTDKHGIELIVKLDQTLNQISADEDNLKKVILNLLDNAVRFTNNLIEVQTLKLSEDQIQVRIRDNGPGIPNHLLAYLTNPFEQIDRKKGAEGYQGIGLGLALSLNIIKKHGGHLWFKNDERGGALFGFNLNVLT